MLHIRNSISLCIYLSLTLLFNSMIYSQSYDIYSSDMQTGITQRLTFLTENDEYNPNWSPDGKFIVHDVLGATVPFGHSLYITNMNTGESNLLRGGEGGNDASWSIDSRHIAFDRLPVGDPSIYIVPASGGESHMICTDALDPDWSPNCQRLVFSRPSDGSVYTIKTDGSDLRFVTYGSRAVWSPDGRYIAFEYQGHVWTVNVNAFGEATHIPKRHTRGDFWYGSPSWSFDSKMLALHSNLDGEFDIWTVATFWGTPKLLAGSDDYGQYDPSFSKRGYVVAYADFTAQNNLAKNSIPQVDEMVANDFLLLQNYPNPFNAVTTIEFQLSTSASVRLTVFDASGKEVAILVSGNLDTGKHKYRFDSSNLPSGLYFCRLQAGESVKTSKLILLK